MSTYFRTLIRRWLHIPDQVIVTRVKLIPEDETKVTELLKQYIDCMSVNSKLIEQNRQLTQMYRDLQTDFNSIQFVTYPVRKS